MFIHVTPFTVLPEILANIEQVLKHVDHRVGKGKFNTKDKESNTLVRFELKQRETVPTQTRLRQQSTYMTECKK